MARIAAIQMRSGHVVEENLASASRLLRAAKDRGAAVACLPENFSFMGLKDADKCDVAEADGAGPVQDFLARSARELGLWILAGTINLKSAHGARVANASLLFDEQGKRVARYDKIHLFDVDVPGRDESYRESAHVEPGSQAVVADTPAGKLGMSVCYDMRFPELYRSLVERGAQWLAMPAAFTVPTGQAHWETLLRARAIENLCYVVAPAQGGQHSNGRSTYGHSLIVDYWGKVLARLPGEEGVITSEFELGELADARARFPALNNRRWPAAESPSPSNTAARARARTAGADA